MNNIIKVTDYDPRSTDEFFFDNNIWMFLFCPIGEYEIRKQKIYSRFLQSIITAKATIYINSLILSEFSNSYLRQSFNRWNANKNLKYKKDYIPTEEYKNNAKEVADIITRQIMRLSVLEKKPDDFNSLDIDIICESLQTIDFNDCYYIEYCKKNSLKLVTDDHDFREISDSSLVIIS